MSYVCCIKWDFTVIKGHSYLSNLCVAPGIMLLFWDLAITLPYCRLGSGACHWSQWAPSWLLGHSVPSLIPSLTHVAWYWIDPYVATQSSSRCGLGCGWWVACCPLAECWRTCRVDLEALWITCILLPVPGLLQGVLHQHQFGLKWETVVWWSLFLLFLYKYIRRQLEGEQQK